MITVGGCLGEAQPPGLAAEDRDELLVDDLDDLLGRVQRLGDLRAAGPLLDRVDEVPDHRQRDVGLEQRDPDLARGGVDVGLGEPALAAEVLEGLGEAVGERGEHVQSRVDGGHSGSRAAAQPTAGQPAGRAPTPAALRRTAVRRGQHRRIGHAAVGRSQLRRASTRRGHRRQAAVAARPRRGPDGGPTLARCSSGGRRRRRRTTSTASAPSVETRAERDVEPRPPSARRSAGRAGRARSWARTSRHRRRAAPRRRATTTRGGADRRRAGGRRPRAGAAVRRRSVPSRAARSRSAQDARAPARRPNCGRTATPPVP